jgi:tetrahydromethanopterin S-methyltransferase subunit H
VYSFTREQLIYDISGIKIGGQPGMYPTVLFGGFFFKGEPDFVSSEKDIKNMYYLSDKTGNPFIPDFFIRKEEYIIPIVDFIIDAVPRNKPFSVDIIEPDLKIKTLEHLDENKLLDRTIFNSIHIGIKDEEKLALSKHKPEMAIIVAFNPKDQSPDGKIEVLENSAHLYKIGLLQIVEEIGIKKILIDTAATTSDAFSGACISAIPVIKEEYGLPTGCAIHNVVEKSKWLDSFSDARLAVDSASNINIIAFGGNFVIFGPAKNSSFVFPIVAWEDILVANYTYNYFGVEPVSFHPRRKII